MTLQKAIELNKESYQSLSDHKFYDHADATKLGIEALDRVLEQRNPDGWLGPSELPSETKE